MNAVQPLQPIDTGAKGPGSDVPDLKSFPIVYSENAEDERLVITDAELRERMCLCGDGEGAYLLLISKAHRNDAAVMSYENRLKRLCGIRPQVRYCMPALIAEAYSRESSGDDSDDATAEIQSVMRILSRAVAQGAQDVKFVVMEDHCRLRFLIDGRGFNQDPVSSKHGWKLVRTLINWMTDLTGSHKTSLNPRIPQDGSLKPEFTETLGLSGVRLSTRPEGQEGSSGVKVTLRLLPKEAQVRSLRESGFTVHQEGEIDQFTENQQGIIIMAGKTGSGKSTLIKKMLSIIDCRERGQLDILTIEDPVEARVSGYASEPGERGGGIVQTPLTTLDGEAPKNAWVREMASGMRHAIRVLVPGEIRDPASAFMAFDIAMSGHLAISTFHAQSIEAVFSRLDGWGVDRDLLLNPALVVGVGHLTLVRKLCDHCKRPLASVWNALTDIQQERYRKCTPVDGVFVTGEEPECPVCNGAGTKGRIIVSELVTPTIRFMEEYREHGAFNARIHWLKEMGGMSRFAHLALHCANGLVDPRHADKDLDPMDKEMKLLDMEGYA